MTVGAVPLSTPLPDALADAVGLVPDTTLGSVVGGLLGATLVATVLLINAAVAGPWAKRRVYSAFIDKIGPNRHGPAGLLIIVADAVRMLSKELIVPEGADRPAFDLAPLVMAASALLGFAVIPFGTLGTVTLQLADPETGLVFVFAVASLASLGLVMAGYASNNKFSFIGGMRAVAQNIAYEIPLVLVGASVALFFGTLQLSEIVAAQQDTLVALGPLEIPDWYAFVNPFAFVLFMTANLAEVGRNPFDIPEAPTEIVAGHMTEYSSVYFVLLYLSEFLHIFLGGALVAILFLGGPAGPVLPGPVWMFAKIWAIFLFTQWARTTFPRVRIDQLIQIGWKFLLVAALGNLLLTAGLVAFV
ncbi:complex I subunit 1 family protein [Salinibaculum salinum]|uniref:complex I subunit 1/NuoH family protein n=1 Tax=Salinibaculum salinum TaxID=3131996 RepID=UPI0030EC89F3